MTSHHIVIATPHARNDPLEAALRSRLSGIEITRIRDRAALSAAALQKLAPRYVFFPHWSWIIPAEVYSQFECVIFHMTDVPYGRGGNPLQNLIIRGHDRTVVSALRCEKELDAGSVYLKRPLSLEGTAEDILRRASGVIEEMIAEIVQNQPIPVQQTGGLVIFRRLTPRDGDLSAATTSKQAYDFIRMLDADGYPAAFLDTEQLHFAFTDARLSGDAVEAKVRIVRKINE